MGNLAENNVIEMDFWTPEDLLAGLCTLAEVGRPKPPIREARRLAQQATPKAIQALIAVAEQNEDLPAKVKAAQAILDRGWGKAEVTQVNINPPEREWPEWLTSRRLAYQESSQYAEDIVPKELQGRPREVLEAPAAAPAPAPAPVSFASMKYDMGDRAYIPPAYTHYRKSQPLQADVVPPKEKVKTPEWGPEPYDETDKEKLAEIERRNAQRASMRASLGRGRGGKG